MIKILQIEMDLDDGSRQSTKTIDLPKCTYTNTINLGRHDPLRIHCLQFGNTSNNHLDLLIKCMVHVWK